MALDLVIRNGTVVDGTGMARYRGDVGVAGDRIVRVGRIREKGRREIDAEGHVVTPGFIDGHTHMDAQIFWDPFGTCSCWHGITTVVMGNCGFTLAPATAAQRELVLRNLERAEDISPSAMAAAIEWKWDTFRSYLDVIDGLPKAINYGAQVGHSALRSYVMGERAIADVSPTEDELAAMERELRDAMDAGAVGFTTSRSVAHVMPDDNPVASRFGAWSEIERLVQAMADTGNGIFELATDGALNPDPDVRATWQRELSTLAYDTGVPVTFGMLAGAKPEVWQSTLAFIDRVNASGGRMFGQSHSREIAILMSFRTRMPFDQLPEWSELRTRSLDEQRRALSDPTTRQRLVAIARDGTYARAGSGADLRKPNYERLKVLLRPTAGNPTVAELARQRGVDPIELMIDLALETDFHQFFVQPNVGHDLDAVLTIMRHPHCVMTFSDAGAHVSQIMDSSIQTNLLAYWTRERQAFTLEEAVRMITLKPAVLWNFADRGLVREGMIADLNVFDPDTVAPEMPVIAHDLPTGAMRLVQKATGFKATVVAGQVTLEGGQHTAAMSGRLLRSSTR